MSYDPGGDNDRPAAIALARITAAQARTLAHQLEAQAARRFQPSPPQVAELHALASQAIIRADDLEQEQIREQICEEDKAKARRRLGVINGGAVLTPLIAWCADARQHATSAGGAAVGFALASTITFSVIGPPPPDYQPERGCDGCGPAIPTAGPVPPVPSSPAHGRLHVQPTKRPKPTTGPPPTARRGGLPGRPVKSVRTARRSIGTPLRDLKSGLPELPRRLPPYTRPPYKR